MVKIEKRRKFYRIISGLVLFIFAISIISVFVNAFVMCDDDFECGLSFFTGVEYCIGDEVHKDKITPECINPGEETSMCVNHTISELLFLCYDDIGEWGDNYCKEDDLYRSRLIITGECMTFNNGISGCSYSNAFSEENFIKDCGDSYCEEYVNYCKGSDVYRKRECFSKGCGNGGCYNNKYLENEIFTECLYGCINGSCIEKPVECYEDKDCDKNGFIGDRYCKEDSIYQDFIENKCLNPGTSYSSCSSQIIETLIKECDYKCVNGRCKGRVIDDKGGFDPINITNANIYFKPGIDFDYSSLVLNESVVEISLSSAGEGDVQTGKYTMSTWVIIMIILVVVLIVLIIIMILVR